MPLPYPSAEDLHSWSRRLQYEANAEREATKRLETQYWNTDARDPTAVAALWQAFVQAEQVAQAFRTRVIADAVAYEDWVSPLAVPRTSPVHLRTASLDNMPSTPPPTVERVTDILTWCTWPDLSAPSGIDPVLCAGACLRVGRHDALQLAVVRHVLAFFATMMSDGRLRLPQDRRKQARVLLQQLQQPLYPAWNTGFFQAYDLSARNWLLALIHDYDQALPRIQQILRDATDTMARITALHVEYPDIPCGKLQDMLQQALRKDGIRLRPAFLAEAIMAWQYGSESLHAIRKALTRARTVQRLEAALGTHRATLAPPA